MSVQAGSTLTEARNLGEVVDTYFKINLNSTTPSANRRTPLLWKKKEGNFVSLILFCIPNLYKMVSPPGQTLLKEKGGEI